MITKNKNKIEISLLICWILTLLSINSNLYGINEYADYQIYSFKKIIILFNYLRFYLPFVIIIFLTSLFFFIKKKFNLILSIFFFLFFLSTNFTSSFKQWNEWKTIYCFRRKNKKLSTYSKCHFNFTDFLLL